jgi:hypothetical protein
MLRVATLHPPLLQPQLLRLSMLQRRHLQCCITNCYSDASLVVALPTTTPPNVASLACVIDS